MKGLSALVIAPKGSKSEEGEDSYGEESSYENAFQESASEFMKLWESGDKEAAIRELKGAIEACVSDYMDSEED